MVQRRVLVGLGSNWGDRWEYLRQAIAALSAEGILAELCASPVYESPAMMPPGAPEEWDMPYLNLVVSARTALAPLELLGRTQTIEAAVGRVHRGHWGPREIDIDLLDMEGVSLDDVQLRLPHPHMLQRDFVMIPLADLLPRWRHPDSENDAEFVAEQLQVSGALVRQKEVL